MELLNKQEFARQHGLTEFSEGDDGTKFTVGQLTKDNAIDWAFDYYKAKNPTFAWDSEVKDNLIEWTNYILQSCYSPQLLTIFDVEKFFEFEIRESWASYSFELNGEEVSGYLKLRGTMDLLVQHGVDYLEYIDYKSGRPMYDWATKTTKTSEDLKHDSQLLLYYYSIRNILPQFKHVDMTLFWIKKGPYPVYFGDAEYDRAENLIKSTFQKIKNDAKVNWVYNDRSLNHQCNYCSLNKMKGDNGEAVCQNYHKEFTQLGLQKLTDKYVDVKRLGDYTGGGQTRSA